jgi:hypothetical protein
VHLIFLFEKVSTESFEWRNYGMEGTACGDVVTVSKIEEKHIFFMTLRTVCFSLFYAMMAQ